MNKYLTANIRRACRCQRKNGLFSILIQDIAVAAHILSDCG